MSEPTSLWTELSTDVREGLFGRAAAAPAPGHRLHLRETTLRTLANQPVESLAVVVVVASVVYWLAERDRNPRVSSFAEALWTVSSTLTVGTDVVRESTVGRLVGTVLMTYGASLQALVTAELASYRQDTAAGTLSALVERLVAQVSAARSTP